MWTIDQILAAAQYATTSADNDGICDDPDLPDSYMSIAENTFFPLQRVVEDQSVPRSDRFAAAMCQFVLQPIKTETELKQLFNEPQVARLFRMGRQRMDPRDEWKRYGIVGQDCMQTYDRWLTSTEKRDPNQDQDPKTSTRCTQQLTLAGCDACSAPERDLGQDPEQDSEPSAQRLG